jgi:flagellin|tara:strand:- start:948 stop:1775 length:828 start_codon:yes stop_codon:yes gene_type:complete
MAITPVNLSASLFKSLRSVDAGEKATAATAVKLATGLKVDSSSNSESFALAQQLRGKIQVASALNQGLNSASGVVSTGLSGVNALSDLNVEIEGKLFELANGANNEAQKDILKSEVGNLLQQAQSFVSNSSFNGVNLIDADASDVSTLSSENGDELVVGSQSGVGTAVNALQTAISDEAKIGNPMSIIENEFAAFQSTLSGATSLLVSAQDAIQGRQDELINFEQLAAEGLGGLVDANIGRETVSLASQNVQSQLAVQTASIANSASGNILSLFK